jgi:hypothetical protein
MPRWAGRVVVASCSYMVDPRVDECAMQCKHVYLAQKEKYKVVGEKERIERGIQTN